MITVIIPAKKKRMPAKSIIDGVPSTFKQVYPFLINGVALPHKAVHKSAESTTNTAFV